MATLSMIGDALSAMLSAAWYFTKIGGWVIYVIGFIYLFKLWYKDSIVGKFIGSNRWIFLHVKIEKENLQSLLAVEQMFSNLHALHTNFTFAEKWLEGKVNLWFSMELVSLGGKISFIVRTPEKSKNLVLSAFYGHFPNAEITEVEDYMKHLNHYDPRHIDWEMWGTEFKMTKDQAYPIRTYRDFEHPSAEEPILDPLAALYEALSRAENYELMAVQYILRPIADGDWVPKSQKLIKKLKEEEEHEKSFSERFLPFLHFGSHQTVFQAMSKQSGHAGHGEEERKQPAMMRMTEGEKKTILGIETKMLKPAWETKIRFLYIAPKDKFDPTKKSAMIGAFRGFSVSTSNVLKPDVSGTWTAYNYALFRNIEKPYVDFKTYYKKEEFLHGFANRSRWIGAKEMVLNAEELATLIHFPLAAISTGAIERIDVKKGMPPANLPVANL